MRTSYSVLTQTQTVQCSLLHTYAIRYSLLLLGYKPVQRVTVLSTVGNCNTAVSVVMYCIVILWDHRRVWGPSLGETSLYGARLYRCWVSGDFLGLSLRNSAEQLSVSVKSLRVT